VARRSEVRCLCAPWRWVKQGNARDAEAFADRHAKPLFGPLLREQIGACTISFGLMMREECLPGHAVRIDRPALL